MHTEGSLLRGLAVLCWVGLRVVVEPSAAGLLPEDMGPGVQVVGGAVCMCHSGLPSGSAVEFSQETSMEESQRECFVFR